MKFNFGAKSMILMNLYRMQENNFHLVGGFVQIFFPRIIYFYLWLQGDKYSFAELFAMMNELGFIA